MITSRMEGVDFVVCNTDAQALAQCLTPHRIRLGKELTKGLGAGANPEVGRLSAESDLETILKHPSLESAHMVFVAAGMGGGTGTGAAPGQIFFHFFNHPLVIRKSKF
jgi:cell division protein FtsZ